jgi:ATP-dependent Clp protease protease subunit
MTIEFKARGATGEIWLYDQIGDGFFSDGVTAKSFQKDLTGLGKVNTINLRINSPGGNVFDGLTIYNQLKAHPARIVVDIDGLAASIASLIAMAGDEIRIAGNAMMMIHNPHGFAAGDANEMRRTAALLEQIKGNLADTYSARTGIDPGTLNSWMDGETWFTAADAVQHGFADSVVQEQRIAASYDLSRFHNVPAALKRAQAQNQAARRDINVVRLDQQAARIAAQRTAATPTPAR